VQLTIKNTGKVAGAEVIQVYVNQQKKVLLTRPAKKLNAFQKVFLKAGESRQVQLTLTNEAFKYYDDNKEVWVAEPGVFTIQAGSSSGDIKLQSK